MTVGAQFPHPKRRKNRQLPEAKTDLTASLDGRVVAYVEARMLSEMGALIARHGGVPLAAPVLQEIYDADAPEVAALIDDLCAGRVDIAILQTGVGARALFAAAERRGQGAQLRDALGRMTVIARSPKPAAILRRHQIRIDLMPPEPFTSPDLIGCLGEMPLDGRAVAVQAYGGPNNLLTRTLRERGAAVSETALYRWGLPEDTGPALRLLERLEDGAVAAVAFTSRPQVGNLLQIAAAAGREDALRYHLNSPAVAVASVGPICTRQLQASGLKVDVEPPHPHMGSLILALAEHYQQPPAP